MNFIISVIYFFLALVTAALVFSLSLNIIDVDFLIDTLNQLNQAISSDPYVRLSLLLFSLLLFISCLALLQRLFSSCKKKSITFDLPNGKATITFSALEEVIRNSLQSQKELSRIKVKVLFARKKGTVIIQGMINTDVNLIEYTKSVQKLIQEKLKNILGDKYELFVKINIKKISLAQKKEQEEDMQAPFRNY